jgi:hypothetical protein
MTHSIRDPNLTQNQITSLLVGSAFLFPHSSLTSGLSHLVIVSHPSPARPHAFVTVASTFPASGRKTIHKAGNNFAHHLTFKVCAPCYAISRVKKHARHVLKRDCGEAEQWIGLPTPKKKNTTYQPGSGEGTG